MESTDWEPVTAESIAEGTNTYFMVVPGGRIYRVDSYREEDGVTIAIGMVFVPDPPTK